MRKGVFRDITGAAERGRSGEERAERNASRDLAPRTTPAFFGYRPSLGTFKGVHEGLKLFSSEVLQQFFIAPMLNRLCRPAVEAIQDFLCCLYVDSAYLLASPSLADCGADQVNGVFLIGLHKIPPPVRRTARAGDRAVYARVPSYKALTCYASSLFRL